MNVNIGDKLPLYELKVDDENIDEVFAISWVSSPAIELDFVHFGKEPIQFAKVDADQHLVMGPILVPDKKILRVDGENKPYEVFFTKPTVKRLSEMYLEKKYTDAATLEHAETISGVNLVESWIVENKLKDKSQLYGFNVPVGTWMGTFRISDETLWQDYIKSGKVKGFSIEGMFEHSLVEASIIDENILNKEVTELSEAEAVRVLKKLKYLIKNDGRYSKGRKLKIEDMEGVQPSITSTYPGEAAGTKKKKDYIHPALIGTKK
jgi:hypothetical protein